MKKNSNIMILGSKVILVPYRKLHVLKYHSWMQDKDLLFLTGSESLSLEEEYNMQQTWLKDENKCTFIVLDKKKFIGSQDEAESMIGDVNLYFNDFDDISLAEIEVMIAEFSFRGHGYGSEALKMMIKYGIEHLNISTFMAKIHYQNDSSLHIFSKLGFKEISRSNIFEQVTLQHSNTDDLLKEIQTQLSDYNIINTTPAS